MRRCARFAPALAVVLLSVAAFSQTLPPGVQKVTSVEGITEYSFPNGLHTLLFPDQSKPKVTVNVTYLVGSRLEGYGETGMAHLLEHMVFKQTKGGRDIVKELTDRGAQFNGSTNYDRTNYFETVSASDDNLRWALALEADRMVNIPMEKSRLDTEMTVVRNEFEMGENQPIAILNQRTMEAAFTFHNYGKTVIGNRSDIEHVPVERLAVFYQKYYQPDNAVLMIAGQFDESKALAFVAQTLGAIPRPQRVLERTWTVEPTQDGERTVTLRRVGDNQAVMAVYHTPAAAHPDTPALQVLATVLGDNPSGRLYKALVDNKKAVSAGMGDRAMHDPGVIMAMATLRPDQSIDDARDTLVKTVEGVVSEPPSKEEVDRAKARMLKSIELALTNTEMIGLTMSEYEAQGDWRLLFVNRDRLRQVTPEDVLRVAKAYLKPSNRTLGEFIPTRNPDRAEVPATPDIATMLKDYKGGETIAAGEAFVPTPANIESRIIRAKLPNGMRLVLLPKKMRGGTVTVQMALQMGDEKSLFGKSAVSQLTSALLMRGTKNKSRQQIQDEIDRLKARMNVGSGAQIETIEANLPGALRLAAEILTEPSFPEAEFEQVKQQRIAMIEQGKSDPMMLGQMALQAHLRPYPRGDVRHVGTPEEQIEDLQKVTLDDVRKFYQQFYGASDAVLAISGQFDPEAVRKLAAELFGEWKSPSPYERVHNPYQKVDTLDRKIETPDKQNALFLAGMNTRLSDDDPDYPAVVIASYMLGGTPASRLFSRIRVKEGFSYSVMAQLVAPTKDDGGMFVAMAICAPQNAPKVEASFRDEMARTLKDGFTAAELATAKKAWLDERPVQRSQDQRLASTLLARERFDRTMKWDEGLESKVAALTLDQVNEALRRHVDLAQMTFVKAGDFKKAGVLQ